MESQREIKWREMFSEEENVFLLSTAHRNNVAQKTRRDVVAPAEQENVTFSRQLPGSTYFPSSFTSQHIRVLHFIIIFARSR